MFPVLEKLSSTFLDLQHPGLRQLWDSYGYMETRLNSHGQSVQPTLFVPSIVTVSYP